MTNSDHHTYRPIFQPTTGMKLCILGAGFFILLLVTSLLTGILSHLISDKRTLFLASSIVQSVLVFICPAWLTARLCYSDSARYLQLSTPTYFRQYIAVAILLALITPLMNLIIDWNANITFPAGLHELESVLRDMEDTAADTTQIILGDSSILGLVSGILVIGCLTGFAEEIFFRGGIQNALTSSGWNPHIAVWLTAFIFSAVHFQFFGFVPRLLLGAVFGYLFYYSGSLKISAFAHALNNSIVVVSSWISINGYSEIDFDRLTFNPLTIVVSTLLAIGFICFCGKIFKTSNTGSADKEIQFRK